MPTVATQHIRIDQRGVAWIDDSNVKVIEVVLDKLSHDSTPEEMRLQYPHLSLAQVYAALSHYHDHKVEFDSEIERQLARVDKLTKAGMDSPFRRRLPKNGKRP